MSIRRLMNSTAHDFVTVEMRGLKAALVRACAGGTGERVGAGLRRGGARSGLQRMAKPAA